MNALQRLELFLAGRAYVGHRRRPGWMGPLPFFAFRCPIHGIVEGYPHGYNDRLDCPFCHHNSVHTEPVEKAVKEILDD